MDPMHQYEEYKEKNIFVWREGKGHFFDFSKTATFTKCNTFIGTW